MILITGEGDVFCGDNDPVKPIHRAFSACVSNNGGGQYKRHGRCDEGVAEHVEHYQLLLFRITHFPSPQFIQRAGHKDLSFQSDSPHAVHYDLLCIQLLAFFIP